MNGLKLTHYINPSPSLIGQNAFEFLSFLGGPAVIHIDGKDNSRCRVIVTLLHGNEPSGLKAVHTLISQSFLPETAVKIIIASVIAAHTEPVFSHRMLAGQRDLNRCFSGQVSDLQGQLAKAIKEQIFAFKPEAIIDLHNTSGSGPAFSVSVADHSDYIALASHFTRRLIHTDIRLGSIMEQAFGCPVITVEAGGAQDQEADLNARLGLLSFLSATDPFVLQQELEVLHHPRRLEIRADATIGFSDSPDLSKHITILQDVEKLNFGVTEASQMLGWVEQNGRGLEHFQLDDPTQKVSRYFGLKNGQITTKQALKLFMVTTRADIAKSDCLFYFVEV